MGVFRRISSSKAIKLMHQKTIQIKIYDKNSYDKATN